MNVRLYRLVIAALVFLPALLSAQTVTTLPLAKSAFCAGEPVKVDYTVAGALNAGNAMVLQISGPDGSFSAGFRNLASLSSTASGSIQTTIPTDLTASTKYRFRVTASNPRVDGSDNGANISIDPAPSINVGFGREVLTIGGRYVLLPGVPAQLKNSTKGAQSFWWNLGIGVGASPEQTGETAPAVTYSTPGEKTITFLAYTANQCEYSTTIKATVLPTVPVIPVDVRIIQGDETVDNLERYSSIWICPGGICRLTPTINGASIYIEAGGSLVSKYFGDNWLIYAKSGASVVGKEMGYGYLVYEEGAGLPTSDHPYMLRVKQPSLTFDYSNVPANGCPSLAPYTVQIKQNANSISSARNDEKSNVEYWVQGNGDLTSAGDGNTYYVEAGGSVTIRGSKNRVYLKDGGTLNVASGEGNRIFYETQGKIENAGYDAVLLPSSGITFEHEGISGVSEGEATTGADLLTISPNPVSAQVHVSVDPSAGTIREVTLFNGLGEQVLEKTGIGSFQVEFPMPDFPSGVYHLRVRTERMELSRKLVKQ